MFTLHPFTYATMPANGHSELPSPLSSSLAVVFILFILTPVRLLPRHRHVATDQKILSRSSLNACPMVRGTRE